MSRLIYGLALTLLSLNAANAALVLNSNAIVNGDAEAGAGSATGFEVVPVPGWTTAGNFTVVQYGAPGGFPTLADAVPQTPGLNFFAGGPDNAFSSAEQTLDISNVAASVDAGFIIFAFSGYFGGFLTQEDNAKLTVEFQDSLNSVINAISIGPVTASGRNNLTGLEFRQTNGIIPVGTRQLHFVLEATRQAGTYNDGYADDLRFVARSIGPEVPEPSTFGMVTGSLVAIAFATKRLTFRR